MKRKVCVFIIFLLSFVFWGAYADNIKLKALSVNPSAVKPQKVIVKFDLPKEVTPQDVVDIGEFQLRYNFENYSYYVYQEVELLPGEKRPFEIVIKDIWIISEEELTLLKEHTLKLKNAIIIRGKYQDTANDLSAEIIKQSDNIIARQNDPAVPTQKHMELYYEHKTVLDEIKYNVGVLEKLAVGLGEVIEDKMGVDFATGAISISDTELAEEDFDKDKKETITLKVDIENPSSEEKTTSIHYPFPEEVRPRDIVERAGFELGYDFDAGSYYAYQEEVKLKPKEQRFYEIVIRDVWAIPQEKLTVITVHAEKIKKLTEGTLFYPKAESLYNSIADGIGAISKAQNEGTVAAAGVVGHIGAYRDNIKRLAQAEGYLAALEEIVSQMGGKPGITVVAKRQGKGTKEITGEAELFPGEIGLKMIAESIFRGKSPSTSTTWRIIYAIIGFLAVMSAIVFFMLFRDRRRGMIEGLTGVFSREYITEKCREILDNCAKEGKKCSLLMVAIDKFKNITEEYGQIVGDDVLREFVYALRKGVRHTKGIIGKIGWDEFLIVLPSFSKEDSEKTAKNLNEIISQQQVKVQDKFLQMTASIGITVYPDDSLDMEDLIEKADRSMCKARDQGGNGVYVYPLRG